MRMGGIFRGEGKGHKGPQKKKAKKKKKIPLVGGVGEDTKTHEKKKNLFCKLFYIKSELSRNTQGFFF